MRNRRPGQAGVSQETSPQLSAVSDARLAPEWSELALRRRRGIVGRRAALVRRAFMLSDLLALALAFVLTEAVYGSHTALNNSLSAGSEYVVFLASLPVWLLILKLYGLYRRDDERTAHSGADDIVPVFNAVTVGVWLFLGAALLTGLAHPKIPKLFLFWGLALVLALFGRFVARQVCRLSASYVQNAVIVGADASGQLIGRKLLQHPEYGLNLLGFVDSRPPELGVPLQHVPYLGTVGDLDDIVRTREVERVIVADPADDESMTGLVHDLKRSDVHIDVVSRLFEVFGPGVGTHKIEGVLLLGMARTRHSRAALVIKRVIDVVIAGFTLILVAPLFAWIAWRVRRDSPGPVFFTQMRLGRDMHHFRMLKFRTMVVGADQESHRAYIAEIMDREAVPTADGIYKLERPDEITRFGRWLRRTSLDELPQLINVIKGDMSLVGPRPCMPFEVEHFQPYHFERFSVPAGMTGLWQVTARARSTFVEALDMDVAYARDWSLGLDLWLLVRTPLQLLLKRGSA
jgi:exopolysaccharide biosynthesis polyprenyl glycosylphosphotransferase